MDTRTQVTSRATTRSGLVVWTHHGYFAERFDAYQFSDDVHAEAKAAGEDVVTYVAPADTDGFDGRTH